MNILSDVITYVRRILKLPSDSQITDNLIIDYINRFWIIDMSARMQLFDLKTSYQFVTQPGVDRYNMPLYNTQVEPGIQSIAPYPVYQGFLGPAFINGIECSFHTQRETFDQLWPNYTQTLVEAGTGNGTNGPYTLSLPFTQAFNNTINFPYTSGIVRGHVDMAGIIATGTNQDPPVLASEDQLIETIPVTSVSPAVYFNSTDSTGANVTICDSGEFLSSNVNCGLLMEPGNAPLGNRHLQGVSDNPLTNYSSTQNTINYVTGIATNVYFPTPIPDGMPINASCAFFELGLPRAILFYNNALTFRSPPNSQYIVNLTAYLTPAAFLSTAQALPYAYMAEYIARGSVRKILSDQESWEQFDRYEPLFREQEDLVHRRSQRQWTATRTQTIYSSGPNGGIGNSNFGLGIN